ncbi:MAG: hypothetical protein K6E50_02640 [Lachnospiraceae bacterium]|nr:hypothetical protein [Lachnospiraceae bacterium]
MKKRLLMLALIGALGCTALAGCGKEEEPSSKEKQEKDKDEDEDEEKDAKDKDKEEDPEDDGPVEVDEEDYDAIFQPLLGEWVYADDDMDPMYLTVTSENGSYYYELEDMTLLGSSKGTVDLFSEEHPDGSVSLWYRFVDEDGNEWASFPVDEDDPYPNDIYSDQDGAWHFMRSASEAQQTEPGGLGDVQGYFFVGSWECEGYTMDVFDNGDDSYFVSIESPEIDDEYCLWEYICNFDEENGFLFSDNGELTRIEMANGEVSSKHSEYANGSVNFYFENGGIVWADHEDPTHQLLVFEYVD